MIAQLRIRRQPLIIYIAFRSSESSVTQFGTDIHTKGETVESRKRPFIFVLMPFSNVFDPVYRLAIKPACDAVNAECERVDEQYYLENMLERIYREIARADIIVADMTGQNPNVFYEVGFAHALRKIVVLVTSRSNDIPFDLKQRQHTIYGEGTEGLMKLREELEKKLKHYLKDLRSRRANNQPLLYLEQVKNYLLDLERQLALNELLSESPSFDE